MSYYALFQGWLLLSQPPGCLRVPTTFPTQARLGGLSWRSGLLPSRRRRLAPAASLVRRSAVGIRSLVEFGNRQSAPSPSSALPPTESSSVPSFKGTTHGCTSMHFGENQLSPGSISISPLSTRHPPVLQHWWVRASTRSYPRFTLPMGSSPGFGSYPGNATYLARFRLAFAPAPRLCSVPLNLLLQPTERWRTLPTYTRRIILQKARR